MNLRDLRPSPISVSCLIPVFMLAAVSCLAWTQSANVSHTVHPVIRLQQSLGNLAAASTQHQPLESPLADVQVQFQVLDQYVDTLLYLPASDESSAVQWHLLLDGVLQQPQSIANNVIKDQLLAYRYAVARIVYRKHMPSIPAARQGEPQQYELQQYELQQYELQQYELQQYESLLSDTNESLRIGENLMKQETHYD